MGWGRERWGPAGIDVGGHCLKGRPMLISSAMMKIKAARSLAGGVF